MENKIELLHYYEDQWKYRNTHYWKLVFKDVYIGVIVILLPHLCGALGITPSERLSPLFFSIGGVVISAVFGYLLMCESARMGATQAVVRRLISEIGEGQYDPPRVKRIYTAPLAVIIPICIFLFHLFLAVVY